MVQNRPQSGFAHFTLSYVLRYAGLSKEAAPECETAVRLDPGNYQFRSCASVFFTTGQFEKARDFLKLDAGSEWSNNVEIFILLRQGKTSEAVERLRKMPESSFFHVRALQACYETPQRSGIPANPGAVRKGDLRLPRPGAKIHPGRDVQPLFGKYVHGASDEIRDRRWILWVR